MPKFRTKARAVELLGKGQISDLPTAISELWKNGYDAYGDKLEAFLYLDGYEGLTSPFVVVSDDGIGMTRADIIDKWIVLGTDSKTRNITEQIANDDTLGKKPRIKMGEKGIGRLSVSYLGSQMLMVTKKIGQPAQCVYFDWRILENYNLFLEDISIPVKAVESISKFSDVFKSLKEEFLTNFPVFKNQKEDPWYEQLKIKDSIIKETGAISLPSFFEDEILFNIIEESGENHGTKFVIFNPDPQLLFLRHSVADKRGNETEESTINYIRSGLSGIFNVFKNDRPKNQTHFWIKDETGTYDFIDKREFFAKHDFDNADHLIEGEFDDHGIFNGKVRVFEKTLTHKFKPIHRVSNRKSAYGSLNIKLGYVQGDRKLETPRLKGEERSNFNGKLKIFGGLYIYRDGIRVLPYGRTEFDFLEFEKRRSEGAGYYFFSHRRIFGYIEISRGENPDLKDKAGREGFINNVAYREFKQDLEAFFIDLAKTYYGDQAKTDYRKQRQAELTDLSRAEKLEHENEKEERKNFAQLLKKHPVDLDLFEKNLLKASNELQGKLNKGNLSFSEIEDKVKNIEEIKTKIDNLKIDKPVRFKPTDLQKKNFQDYNKTFLKVKSTTIAHSNSIIELARDVIKDAELLQDFKNRYSQFSGVLESKFEEYKDKFSNVFKNLELQLANEKRDFLKDFEGKYNEIYPKEINKKEIKDSLKILERVYSDLKERIDRKVKPFVSHLEKIKVDSNEDDLIGYYKIKYEEMEEEWEKTRELAQLGIAVEVIDHQFHVLYSQMSNSIDSIQESLNDNKTSAKNFQALKNSFQHLESNYKLLTPLYRTTGRVRKNITGQEIFEYVSLFFQEQFKDKNIKFTISSAAKSHTIFSYESIFKPVFVNIVNNAIYWMQSSQERDIKIDLAGDKILIMNSGEPIDDYLLEDVFKLFYSKRPKGRGIGLYLAKTSLNGVGFDIEASNDSKFNKLKGACFIIKPIK